MKPSTATPRRVLRAIRLRAELYPKNTGELTLENSFNQLPSRNLLKPSTLGKQELDIPTLFDILRS